MTSRRSVRGLATVLTSLVIAMLLSAFGVTTALADEPVTCPWGVCGVGVVDPGSPAGPNPPSEPGTQPGTGSTGSSGPSGPECHEVALDPQPVAGSLYWNGHTAAEGALMVWTCSGGLTPETCTYCTVLIPHFVPTGGGAAPVEDRAASQATAVQTAFKLIPNPTVVVNFGPDPAQVAVKIPVWLWIERPDLAPVTATAGTVTVTATPVVDSVTWSMGDPVDPRGQQMPFAFRDPLVCTGEAMYSPAPESVAWDIQPPCGYSYHWVSTAERTSGSEKWTVSATVDWHIEWTSNLPGSGQLAGPAQTAAAQLRVGQWTAIAVPTG